MVITGHYGLLTWRTSMAQTFCAHLLEREHSDFSLRELHFQLGVYHHQGPDMDFATARVGLEFGLKEPRPISCLCLVANKSNRLPLFPKQRMTLLHYKIGFIVSVYQQRDLTM